MKIKYISTIIILVFSISSCTLISQDEAEYKKIAIGFYNLENLFDTIDDHQPLLSDEFTPEGRKQWTSKRYHEKLVNMAYVISDVATDVTPDGLALLGVCEVENSAVLEDLINDKQIKERDYKIVHYDSPDRRGIDVGLLYQPKYFKVTNSKSYFLSLEDTSFRSRDQLVVTGILNSEEIHVIVNHWPSRRGGEEKSRYKRNAAGDLSRSIVDSLLKLNKKAKIIVMGDFNDDPVNSSVIEHLSAKGKIEDLQKGDIYNPMYDLFDSGIGTLQYKGVWNLFDQVFVSQGLLGKNKSGYKYDSAGIYNKEYLIQKEGSYAGYPLRTFGGKTYLAGYSDHFPVYIYLRKK